MVRSRTTGVQLEPRWWQASRWSPDIGWAGVLSEYLEEVEVRRSAASGRLCLRTRYYEDDFFGSSIPGYLASVFLVLAARDGALSFEVASLCIAGLALSGAAIASVHSSYRLIRVPGSPDQGRNRSAAVSALKAIGWEIRRDNRQYLAGFRYPDRAFPQVIVVIHRRGEVLLSCRAGSSGRFGRVPFQARRLQRSAESFRRQFAQEVEGLNGAAKGSTEGP